MIERTLEPALMDDPEQARAYAAANFEAANTLVCELVARHAAAVPRAARILDLGCGPGHIAIRLAQKNPAWRVTAIDGARAMLDLAAQAVTAAALEARFTLVLGLIPEVELDGPYDLVLSNSLLHHLPDPHALWTTVRRAAGRSTRVVIMDLMRPPSDAAARAIVEQYSGDEPEVLRRDFHASLHAAFTVEEVRAQLVEQGLGELTVAPVSDRHLAVWGTVEP